MVSFREDLEKLFDPDSVESIVKLVLDHFGEYHDRYSCCSDETVNDLLKEPTKSEPVQGAASVFVTDDDWILRNALGPRDFDLSYLERIELRIRQRQHNEERIKQRIRDTFGPGYIKPNPTTPS